MSNKEPKTKACPKCGRPCAKTHEGRHHLGHRTHATLHALKHGYPILAALGLAMTALGALGVGDPFYCATCNHRF